MPLTTDINRQEYTGNGATVLFPFDYYFLADGDLTVIKRTISTGVEITQSLTTHYTVTGAGVPAGGSITMLVPPTADEQIVIFRDPDITQATDLVDNDNLPVNPSIETPLDRLTMIAQRIFELVQRSVRMSDGDTSTGSVLLPPDRASKFAAWDASKNLIAAAGVTPSLGPVSAFAETLLDDANAAAGRATLKILDPPYMAGTTGGTGAAYTLSLNSNLITTLTGMNGLLLTVEFDKTNTAVDPTLNLNSIGAKVLTWLDNNARIEIGDIVAGKLYPVLWDESNNQYRLIGTSPRVQRAARLAAYNFSR